MSQEAASDGLELVAYVAENGGAGEIAIDDVPVIEYAEWRERRREAPALIAALDPRERRRLAERIASEGGDVASVVREERDLGDFIARTTAFGPGTLIGPGAFSAGYGISCGSCAIVMTPFSGGHDIAIGDFVTIHPSVAISGYVTIGDGAVLGAGAVIANGTAKKPLSIGAAATVAAGTVVTKSVAPGTVVSGNPGRTLRKAPCSHQ